MLDAAAAVVQEYINAGPPYIGESNFKDKELVKSLGGRWNGESKKWAAGSKYALAQLIRSNKWLPSGFTYNAAMSMLQLLETSVQSVAGGGCGIKFDRRGEKDCKFDPYKDKEVAPCGKIRIYARFCGDCNVLLDSRLQFGLECDCDLGCAWKACHGCFVPLKLGEACPHCK